MLQFINFLFAKRIRPCSSSSKLLTLLNLFLPLCGTQGSHKNSRVPSILGSPCRCVHVSPAAFSSLCLGLSMPLRPRQPSSLQFPLYWALHAAASTSAQQPSVPSVLGSPCRCVPRQPSSLQFPLSWALLVAVSHVSPVAFSSLCLGLSLSLCPTSAQQPSFPSVLGSPCHCVPRQPSSLQFPMSWALLVAVPHVSPAAFISLCLGLSLSLCPTSAQ